MITPAQCLEARKLLGVQVDARDVRASDSGGSMGVSTTRHRFFTEVEVRLQKKGPGAVKAVVAITNNHYQGQAAVNALQLKSWASGRRVPVPEPLLEAYPQALAGVAVGGPEQPDLFAREKDLR